MKSPGGRCSQKGTEGQGLGGLKEKSGGALGFKLSQKLERIMKRSRAQGCCRGSGSVQPVIGGWRSQSQTFLAQRSFRFPHGTLGHKQIAKRSGELAALECPNSVLHFTPIIITLQTKYPVSQCIHNVRQRSLVCDIKEEPLIWITGDSSDFPKERARVSLSPEIVTQDLSSRWGSISCVKQIVTADTGHRQLKKRGGNNGWIPGGG